MKNKLPLIGPIILLGCIIFISYNSSLEKRDLQKKVDLLSQQTPSISIYRVRIDSVDTSGKVFSTELHAGESGSSGDESFQITFEPTDESKRWAKSKFFIPEEGKVFILNVEYNGKRKKELITPSW